jgi:bacterioferritin-associated ferredoxin
MTVCRCELITDEDVKAAIDQWDARTLNEVKLLTRAGKGACQGRCCFSVLRSLVAYYLRVDPTTLQLPRARLPVRPVPIVLFRRPEEAPDPDGHVLNVLTLRDPARE